ncbi:MAG: Ig-like domain-containing protein, partial [Angustibacter sp.]
WTPGFKNISPTNGVYPQPMFTDIVFDNGNMVLGIRDRAADQFGVQTKDNPASNTDFSAVSAGETLRACGSPDTGWTLESNGTCGGVTTPGANNQNGPGNGEFYYRDEFVPHHTEVSLGGLAQVPGYTDVMSTVFDPSTQADWINDGGVRRWNNTTGNISRLYRLYDTTVVNSTFGKANGLGDLIALCDAAPIEMGNRLWIDADRDGMQDAGETPLAGVTVDLYKDGNKVGSAVTNAQGEYRFTSTITNDANLLNALGGGLSPNGNFEIRVPNALGANQQTPLAGLSLTAKDFGSLDSIDSDAVAAGSVASIQFSTGPAGHNNHTYDIGFIAGIVAPDTGTTPADTNITIDPLANDTIAADPSSVLLLDPADGTFKKTVTIPGEGTYTVDPTTGKVTFDPLPTFVGEATPVTYQVKDTSGNTFTSTITITVTPPPAVKPDTATTPQNTNVVIDPLLNDLPSSTGKPLDPTSVLLKDPADGTFKKTVTIPGEGTYTVDPTTGKVTFDPLPTFTGTATPVTYQVKDSDGAAATSTITVTVTPITPTAVNDAGATPEDTNITLDILGNDVAGSPSVPLDPTSVLLLDPADGLFKKSVTIAGQGTYTVDPVTGKVTFDPLPTFKGTTTPLTYQVKDANGTPVTAKIAVTVTDAPKALPDLGSTPLDTNITIDPLTNDTIGGGGAPFDKTSVLLKDPADGTFKKTVTIP